MGHSHVNSEDRYLAKEHTIERSDKKSIFGENWPFPVARFRLVPVHGHQLLLSSLLVLPPA